MPLSSKSVLYYTVMAGGSIPSGDGTTSVVKIMANIFISFIGSGVLGLPYAFREVSKSCETDVDTVQ